MKLEKWALVAEIIGAIAIVFTVAVLVVETRRNTAATYARNYDQLSADMADWRMQLAANADMQAAYFSVLNDDECVWNLPAERVCDTGILVASALFLIYERAYFSHEYGQLGDQEWARYERSMCGNFGSTLFPRLNQTWFTDEYANFIESCSAEE